jgi:hypothetical protein
LKEARRKERRAQTFVSQLFAAGPVWLMLSAAWNGHKISARNLVPDTRGRLRKAIRKEIEVKASLYKQIKDLSGSHTD